jgi:trans-aconitate 2-methyltransferase
MLEVARARINTDTPHLAFAEGSVETLDLREEFDLVVSFNALHWVSDHPEAFARMRRALVPGGRAVLQLVCEGERRSVEDVASSVAAGSAYSDHLSGATAPYHHPVEAVFLDEAREAGFAVVYSRVDDLTWDFETPTALREWLRVGFSAWLLRLPDDAMRTAFVDDVATAYAGVVDSVTVVRFLQLRVELRRA